MKFSLPLLAGALAFVDGVSAYYTFSKLILDGKETEAYQYIKKNTNKNSPVTDVTSLDIVCNAGGLESGSNIEVATVKAGSTVGFACDPFIGHQGPVSVYMSLADGDVKTYDGSGKWFKIFDPAPKLLLKR